ncbi:MAG TPA: cbb3-type cytochrome oxidase assembly protein CcoS [Steroidobacteraceae bacterium]|nr:cbb3-type cytochrome oxidase assembly protein CcoS [Steroidobacteraceae bacterium]
MEILYLMVPLGMVLVGVGVWAFFWAVGSGQFDDLDSPGWSVLGDDKTLPPPEDEHADQESSRPPEPPAP